MYLFDVSKFMYVAAMGMRNIHKYLILWNYIMYQINYQFVPGDTVYAVTTDNKFITGIIQHVESDVYPVDDIKAERLRYIILIDSYTVLLDADRVFATRCEALYFLSLQLGASPTPTPTNTVTPTPSRF